MRLLVFGTSDSGGDHLPCREQAWPWQVGRALEAARGEPVEVVHRQLYLEADPELAYFNRELARHEPDIVVLTTSAFSFTFRTVPYRLRRRFGRRAGDWAAARVRQFDAALPPGEPSLRGRIGAACHSLAQRIIGTSAQHPYRPVLANYLAAIDRLAQLEATPVVVVGSAQFRSDLARKWPKQEAMIIDFNRRLERACGQRRLGWVDKEGMTRRLADRDGVYLDPVHKGQAYHDGVAAEVSRLLV